jgi:hypothetical protein
MKNTDAAGCFTHPIPPNRLGYFAQHSEDNLPLPPDVALAMINGPITDMQPKLTAELAGRNEEGHEE